MDETNNKKRRERIKTILIFFLAILLVLTFFSNTIMNYTLPTVTTYNAYSMQINEKVRGNGTINSKQDYKVKATGSRKVTSINVKVGDAVKKGDLLMVLDSETSGSNNNAVQEAEEALRTAEVDYQKALLKLPKDYTDSNVSISRAREDLQEAVNKLEEARRKQSNAITEDANNQATRKSNEATAKMTELKGYLDSITSGSYEAVPSSYTSSITSAIYNLQSAQDAYNEAKANVESLGASVSSYSSSSSDSGDSGSGSYSVSGGSYSSGSSVEACERALKEKELKASRALEDYHLASPEEELQKKRDWEDAEREVDDAREALENAKRQAEEDDARQRELEDAKAALKEANDQVTYATNAKAEAISDAKRNIDQEIAVLQKEIDSYKEITEAYAKQKDSTVESLENDVKTKQHDLEDKIRKLEEDKLTDDNSAKSDALDLETKRLDVEKKKKALEKAKKDSGTVNITAEGDGIVKELNAAVGDSTAEGTALATINLTNAGFVVELNVTNEQAKKVRVGTSAEARGYFGSVNATLSAIKADPSSNKNRILVFDLSGEDLTPGENVEMTISCSSQQFDTVVPNSAIQTSDKGKYVLVARSKSTPLGNRYYANKVDVKVLASDDQYTAVQGELSSGDAVIKTSEKPLSPGAQVRLEDK